MVKIVQRFLSILLVLTLISNIIPVGALAAEVPDISIDTSETITNSETVSSE